MSGKLFGQWAEPPGLGRPGNQDLGARGLFQVADEAPFCLGRVLQGPDDSRTRLRCGRLGGLKALWYRLEGIFFFFNSSGSWWWAGHSHPGPRPLGLAATPRPSPTGTRWPGRGQGGLEFVIPGRVCGRNAGFGIGGKGGGSRRERERARSLRGSVAQDIKRNRGKTRLATIQLVER